VTACSITARHVSLLPMPALDGAMLLVAAVVLVILPLTLWLRPVLRPRAASA
jgi:hypothetical protein